VSGIEPSYAVKRGNG